MANEVDAFFINKYPGQFPSQICGEYNKLKQRFASNTEPAIVCQLKGELQRRGLAEIAWMAGAGGYLYFRLNLSYPLLFKVVDFYMFGLRKVRRLNKLKNY